MKLAKAPWGPDKTMAVQWGLGFLCPCPRHSGITLPASLPVGLGLPHMSLLLRVLAVLGTPVATAVTPDSGVSGHSLLLPASLTLYSCPWNSQPLSLAPLLSECLVSGLHGWPCLTLSWPEGWGGGMGGVCTVPLLFRGSGWDQCLLLCFSPWLESWQARGGAASLPAASSPHPSLRQGRPRATMEADQEGL